MNMRGPKIRLSRQLGIALTPKAARALERRKNPPGQHGGTKDRLKGSDYKRHLMEKQCLRAQYNIEEKQMRNYVRVAMQRRGNPVDSLIQLLETRLDAIVYRAGLARTIYSAQHFISHGHILVNGKRVNIPITAAYSQRRCLGEGREPQSCCLCRSGRGDGRPSYGPISRSFQGTDVGKASLCSQALGGSRTL